MTGGTVVAVAASATHSFSKEQAPAITLIEGLGVDGDAHAGATDQHLSHKRRDPLRPNLRQVHLLMAEVLDEVAADLGTVPPGAMGENVTTRGVDLLGLPTDTVLELGPEARIRVTGLRNPCVQIDRYRPGLLGRMVRRDEAGEIVRRSGVMAVVEAGGTVRPGDPIRLRVPDGERLPLQPV